MVKVRIENTNGVWSSVYEDDFRIKRMWLGQNSDGDRLAKNTEEWLDSILINWRELLTAEARAKVNVDAELQARAIDKANFVSCTDCGVTYTQQYLDNYLDKIGQSLMANCVQCGKLRCYKCMSVPMNARHLLCSRCWHDMRD